jgi:uncharacterized DUF497 family protein
VELEWDDGKRLANLAKHGLDFARASELFAGLVVAADDTRREYRERRVIAIGISAGNVLTCVYTDRTTADGRVVRRIISLRPASRKERERCDDDTRPAP